MCLVLVKQIKQHFVPNGSLLVRIYRTLRSLHCHKCVANFLLCSPILMSRAEKCETQLQISNAFLRRIFTFILYAIINRTRHLQLWQRNNISFSNRAFPLGALFSCSGTNWQSAHVFLLLSPLTLAHIFKICYL